MKTYLATCFFLFPLVLLFASCVIPESNHVEPTYHLLSELQSDRNDTSEIGRVSFYVRQVELPSYLQESRLVSRPKQGLIEFTENDRWGEPLEEGIARVLGLNLSKRLDALSYSVSPEGQRNMRVCVISHKYKRNALQIYAASLRKGNCVKSKSYHS